MFVQFCHNGEGDSNTEAERSHSRAGHVQTRHIPQPWQCPFSIAGVIPRLVSKTDKLRVVQHDPVPTGVMGLFQRLLQIYREYRKATERPSSQPGG